MSGFFLAEFATAHETIAAADAAARSAIPAVDVLSPNPLEGIAEHLAPQPAAKPIGRVMFIAGALGAIAGYLLQWYSAVIDYPIDSGGRPLNSWPAFMLVPYEAAILAAGVVGVLAWMWMCGLPRLFHPLFAADIVERASQDRYFLVFAREAGLKPRIEAILQPCAVYEVIG